MGDEKQLSQEGMLKEQKQNCIFCKIIKKEIPSKIVYSDKICTAILDINPANEGHLILIPNEHYSIMPQVPEDVISHMAVISKKLSKSLLISTMGKSTSIFIANGAAAGQKAPHFMMHIIPRKNPNEFFKIPIKEINPNELNALQKVVTMKMNALLGIKIEEKHDEKPKEILNNYVDDNQVEEFQEIIEEPKKVIAVNPSLIPINEKKIFKAGIKKEPGYLYFVDEDGDIARVKMSRGRRKKDSKKEKVSLTKPEHDKEEHDEEVNKQEVTLDDISNLLLGGKR